MPHVLLKHILGHTQNMDSNTEEIQRSHKAREMQPNDMFTHCNDKDRKIMETFSRLGSIIYAT